MTQRAVLLGACLVLSASAPVAAQAGLRVIEIAADGVRVDGSLRDWRRARFVEVGTGDDASFRYVLGHDAGGLYVAAGVRDDRLVRTRDPGPMEDALVLTLVQGEHDAVQLWLFAGVTGRSAASAAVSGLDGRRLRAVSGARVVEGPLERGRGYVIEAYVPFGPLDVRSLDGVRGALRLRDVDSEARPAVEAEPATSEVNPRRLDLLPPLVPSGGARAQLEAFLAERDLGGTRPSHELRRNVSGDARDETVYVVDRFVVVLGPGYREGAAYDYFELPVLGAGGVRSAEARDLTGDGHDELVVVLRQGNDLGARHVWQVIAFDGEAVRPVWGVETRKEAAGGFVEAEVAIRAARGGGGPPTIEVTAGRAQGLDATTYREAPAPGVEPILLPWGPVASRSHRWNGTAFAASGERANPRYVAPAPVTPTTQPAVTAAPQREPEPPPPPGIDALVDAFRRERGIGRDVAARFRRTVNVAEDPRPEQVMVFGKAVLVIGPGYRDGRGWLYYELPVAAADDVVSVDVADLTGDGRAEIVVRVRQALEMSRPSAEPVRREVLLVHQLTPQGFPRLGAIEVAREMGAARVDNELAFTRAGRGRALEIRPGRARAWDAASWPFADGATGDGVETLLLPWRDRSPVRFRVEGGRLVR